MRVALLATVDSSRLRRSLVLADFSCQFCFDDLAGGPSAEAGHFFHQCTSEASVAWIEPVFWFDYVNVVRRKRV